MSEKLKGRRVIWVDPERPFAAAGIVLEYSTFGKVCILWEFKDPRRKESLKTWVDGVDVFVTVPVPLADWLESQGDESN